VVGLKITATADRVAINTIITPIILFDNKGQDVLGIHEIHAGIKKM